MKKKKKTKKEGTIIFFSFLSDFYFFYLFLIYFFCLLWISSIFLLSTIYFFYISSINFKLYKSKNTSTSQQGKYLTFDKAYVQHVEKFRLGLLPVLSSPSRPFHRESGIITFLSHDSHVDGQWSQGYKK